MCVGAANGLPEDEALAAFGDRFLLHAFVEPVPDAQLESLLSSGWQSDFTAVAETGSMPLLDLLCRHMHDVDMEAARPALADAIRQLRAAGIRLSDRRIVKTQRLVAAAAVLAGRTAATSADLWPLLYALPTQASQEQAREALRELFAQAEHPHLHHAVEAATQQPRSRSARLLAAAQACLEEPDAAAAPQLESVLREIDANFAPEQLSPELGPLREQLLRRLRALEVPAPAAS